MTKRIWLVSLIVIIAVLLTSVPVFAAPDKDKEPLDKIIFVHYPKDNNVKPDSGGGTTGGTGVLCPDYKYSGVRWPTGTVSYYINDNSNVTGAGAALQAAMATWDNASGGLTFTNAGPTTILAGLKDGNNVISWGDVGYANAIAVTYIWYSRATKKISEVDTIMSSTLPWSVTLCPISPNLSGAAASVGSRYADQGVGVTGTYDVQNIMTHEAGHWLMLSDLYNGKDSLLTMYGYGSLGEIAKDTLGYGDELGLEKAYGQ